LRRSSPDHLTGKAVTGFKTVTDDGTIGASNRPNINFKAFRNVFGSKSHDVRNPIMSSYAGTDSTMLATFVQSPCTRNSLPYVLNCSLLFLASSQ
jgi:hypothetical protein